jgi:hypothetical protein
MDRHPVDAVADDLVGVYHAGARRLEALVRDALRRGLDPQRVGTPEQVRGDATAAYRARQLQAARAILAELDQHAGRSPVITRQAYASTLLAIDHVIDPGDSEDAALSSSVRFGGIHQAQVGILSHNLERSLRAAVGTVGANVDLVFARADALAGGVPLEGIAGAPRFIGRRQDDAWRRFALETLAQGTVTQDTRRQISRTLARRLIDHGVTDALTGFVDRAGRRWPLDTYTEMVARTTTREASSRAVVNRLQEHGEETIGITSHPHREDVCTPYDGRTFAMPGTDAAASGRYPIIDVLPPFHPRCRHAAGPGGGLLDAYERELGIVAKDPPRADGPPRAPAPRPEVSPFRERREFITETTAAKPRINIGDHPLGDAPAPLGEKLIDAPAHPPPFGPNAVPQHGNPAEAADLLESQRVADLIAGDPGPEPGRREAWEREVDIEHRNLNRDLNRTLGAETARFIDRKWGRVLGIRRSILEGNLTIEHALELADEEWSRLEAVRVDREIAHSERAFKRGSIPCFVCGRFKPRPSSVCDHCGDVPGTVDTGMVNNDYKGDSHAFDRAYGYA